MLFGTTSHFFEFTFQMNSHLNSHKNEINTTLQEISEMLTATYEIRPRDIRRHTSNMTLEEKSQPVAKSKNIYLTKICRSKRNLKIIH